jgi:Uma2 family endonuclease
MGTTTRMSFAEFLNLPEREGMIYELDDGQLLTEASPAALHNLIRQRIALRLLQFLESAISESCLKKQTFGSLLT